MCLYKKAMSLEENNKHLLENGYQSILKKEEECLEFDKSVPLFCINTDSKIIEYVFHRKYCDAYYIQNTDGECLPLCFLFASREFAQAILDRINFIMGKKVIYKNEEYFVCDWLDPYKIGLHEEYSENHHLSEMYYARLDELELKE